MAINAYTGLQGSGKSYEATLMVVVPAIREGRRVVTNINGISEPAIYEYLEKRGGDPDKFGTILHIINDQVQQPGFFPEEGKPEEPSVVQAGDLVVIDEAWRFWPSDEKMAKTHMEFFRMHRHYTHPGTGVSCDVALILQSIGDLHRTLKAVVELHSRTTKLKTIGQPTRYRVELFEGAKLTKAAKFDSFLRKYDPEVFPLYKSYDGIAGTETAIDDRQNVFKNPRVWVTGAAMLLMMIAAIWTLVWLYKSRFPSKTADELSPTKPAATVAMTPGAPTTSLAGRSSPMSSQLRIAGVVVVRGQPFVAITDSSGQIRLENSGLFTGYGVLTVGMIEGQKITTWTGGAPMQPTQSVLPGVLK